MRITLILAILYTAFLTGCDSGKQAPPPKLFESQRNALDKAKGVQDTLQQQADQQREEIDKQTDTQQSQ